jgi:hypothetical protein
MPTLASRPRSSAGFRARIRWRKRTAFDPACRGQRSWRASPRAPRCVRLVRLQGHREQHVEGPSAGRRLVLAKHDLIVAGRNVESGALRIDLDHRALRVSARRHEGPFERLERVALAAHQFDQDLATWRGPCAVIETWRIIASLLCRLVREIEDPGPSLQGDRVKRGSYWRHGCRHHSHVGPLNAS